MGRKYTRRTVFTDEHYKSATASGHDFEAMAKVSFAKVSASGGYSKDQEEEYTEQFDSQSNETSQFYVGEGVCETDPQEWYKKLTDDVGNIAPLGRGTEIAPQFELMTKKNFRRSTTSRRRRHTCSCCSQMPTASLTLTQSSQVSSQDVREGILDGSVLIYKVRRRENNNATGTIGDQRYA